jgi:hypothetical protein
LIGTLVVVGLIVGVIILVWCIVRRKRGKGRKTFSRAVDVGGLEGLSGVGGLGWAGNSFVIGESEVGGGVGVEGGIEDAVPGKVVSEDGDRDFMDEKMQEWILNRVGTEDCDSDGSCGSEGEGEEI